MLYSNVAVEVLPHTKVNCGLESPVWWLFLLRQILETKFSVETHHVFIDFKPAYDSIERYQLCVSVTELMIPQYNNETGEHGRDNWFSVRFAVNIILNIKKGFTKGTFWHASCLIFIRKFWLQKKGTIFYKSAQIFDYADDLDITGISGRAFLPGNRWNL